MMWSCCANASRISLLLSFICITAFSRSFAKDELHFSSDQSNARNNQVLTAEPINDPEQDGNAKYIVFPMICSKVTKACGESDGNITVHLWSNPEAFGEFCKRHNHGRSSEPSPPPMQPIKAGAAAQDAPPPLHPQQWTSDGTSPPPSDVDVERVLSEVYEMLKPIEILSDPDAQERDALIEKQRKISEVVRALTTMREHRTDMHTVYPKLKGSEWIHTQLNEILETWRTGRQHRWFDTVLSANEKLQQILVTNQRRPIEDLPLRETTERIVIDLRRVLDALQLYRDRAGSDAAEKLVLDSALSELNTLVDVPDAVRRINVFVEIKKILALLKSNEDLSKVPDVTQPLKRILNSDEQINQFANKVVRNVDEVVSLLQTVDAGRAIELLNQLRGDAATYVFSVLPDDQRL